MLRRNIYHLQDRRKGVNSTELCRMAKEDRAAQQAGQDHSYQHSILDETPVVGTSCLACPDAKAH